MAQWLRVLMVLAEYLGLVPRTHKWLTMLIIKAPGNSVASSGL